MKNATRRPFAEFHCSIARALDHIEPAWTPLILRDVFFGLRRFDELCKDLGIASNVLSTRLDALIEKGILERFVYREHPPRYEYRPTKKGAELFPILLGLMRWGDTWTSEPDGPPVELRHKLCGRAMHARVVCHACGNDITLQDVAAHSGPGAHAEAGSALLATRLPPDPALPRTQGTRDPRARAARRARTGLRERFDKEPGPAAGHRTPSGEAHYRKSLLAAARKKREQHRAVSAPRFAQEAEKTDARETLEAADGHTKPTDAE
ncbi:MAG TPA: helix-turn-helix domain-containing protein [Polyangiaceae bacterium]|nr:helix-turn-helix domain-containing protein [Polyangiaceae bacterium]